MRYGTLFNPLLVSTKPSKKAGTRGYRGRNDTDVRPTKRGKIKAEMKALTVTRFNFIRDRLAIHPKYLNARGTVISW